MPFLNTLASSDIALFLEVIQDSLAIRRHQEFFHWLRDGVQHFLPHDILIAAWGDFALGLVHFDVISHLPGMRTAELDREELLPLLIRLFKEWVDNGRSPYILHFHEKPEKDASLGDLITYMRSALVQGMKDERGRHDCLYICLSSQSQTFDHDAGEPLKLLLPYIDAALRQVSHLPAQLPAAPNRTVVTDAPEDSDNLSADTNEEINSVLGLSQRELGIIHWVCLGKTNQEIGQILNISFFTVKNHLQRIFRKLDVLNRTQAVAKCERLGLHHRKE
jgi:transcriptional regulator EpsA